MSLSTFPVPQNKFNNGEISPDLFGDRTHPKYAASLRTCKNWLPIQNGALVKWPGTKFVGHTKGDGIARLIPFVFSDGFAFVLEFGNLYVRFWRLSQYVTTGYALATWGSAAVAYELVTPWTTAMLPYLKFAQVGNTITICYGGQVSGVAAVAPQDLTRTANANGPWAIGATPMFIPHTIITRGSAVSIAAWSALTTYKSGDMAAQDHVLWLSIQDSNLNHAPPSPPTVNAATDRLNGNIYWIPAVDTAHPAVGVLWAFTLVIQDPNGITYETGLGEVLAGNGPISSDRRIPLLINVTGFLTDGGAGLPAGWTPLLYRVYRTTATSTSGPFGWLADVAYTGTSQPYLDDGREPDFTRQPPQLTDPFLVNGTDAYPTVPLYLDQRRGFAGGAGLPHGLAFSRDGDFYNWDDMNVPGSDTDSIRLLLASEVLEQVRGWAALARGVGLTGQGEFTISGVNGGALSRSSRSAVRQSKWGSSWLNPIIIGKGLLFNTAKSNQVRDFYPLYGLYNDNWDGQDLSITARHLFDNYTLSDWSFQSVPYPVVRAIRSDGVLVCLTYQHAPPSFGQQLTEGISAWSRRLTGVGYDSYTSTCVVPEPPEDAVYYVVTRVVSGATVRLIERESNAVLPFVPAAYAPPVIPASFGVAPNNYSYPGSTGVVLPDARYGVFLDASLQFDGHVDPASGNNGHLDSVANPGSTNVADFAQGKQVTFQSTVNSFVNTDPGNATITLDPENVYGLGPVVLKVVGYTNATLVTCEVQDGALTADQMFQWTAGRGGADAHWAIGHTTYIVAHLSGYQKDSGLVGGARGVWVLADGNQVDPANFTWVAGVLTLAQPATVVCVGIAYNCDAELLDATTNNAEIRNRFKGLKRMGFEVANTRDLYVGKDLNSLTQWIQRQVADKFGNIPLATGYFEQNVMGGFTKYGRASIRHFTPLPATVTSVLREFELGGT